MFDFPWGKLETKCLDLPNKKPNTSVIRIGQDRLVQPGTGLVFGPIHLENRSCPEPGLNRANRWKLTVHSVWTVSWNPVFVFLKKNKIGPKRRRCALGKNEICNSSWFLTLFLRVWQFKPVTKLVWFQKIPMVPNIFQPPTVQRRGRTSWVGTYLQRWGEGGQWVIVIGGGGRRVTEIRVIEELQKGGLPRIREEGATAMNLKTGEKEVRVFCFALTANGFGSRLIFLFLQQMSLGPDSFSCYFFYRKMGLI